MPDDGWKAAGYSEEDYYTRLLQARALYKPYGIPVAIFCYGAGAGGGWDSFNVEDAATLLTYMANYREEPHVPEPTPIPANGIRAAVNVPGGVNLRQTPGGAVIRALPYAEEVTVWAQPAIPAGTWTFIPVLTSRGEQGVAAQKVAVNGVWTDTFIKALLPGTFRLKAPFRKYQITSHFDVPRSYGKHEGLDVIDTTAGIYLSDPIVHVGAPGKVTKVGYNETGYGHYVIVDFGAKWVGWYGHFEEIYVREGQILKDWQILGLMGSSGNSTGAHVHVNLQHIGNGLSGYVVPDVVDPEPFLISGGSP
jgi:murein DD-endopeptidase MepM/ murein hydrolase activator NlpD